jgi:hypothetical protein
VGKSKRHAAEIEGISKQDDINPSPGIVFMEKQVFYWHVNELFSGGPGFPRRG